MFQYGDNAIFLVLCYTDPLHKYSKYSCPNYIGVFSMKCSLFRIIFVIYIGVIIINYFAYFTKIAL